ncbi:prophage tail fiber family protein, partial [Escherichia coli 09BKT076207]
LGPADILESDENGIIPEQDRVITQVVILDADKKADTVCGKTAANPAC